MFQVFLKIDFRKRNIILKIHQFVGKLQEFFTLNIAESPSILLS